MAEPRSWQILEALVAVLGGMVGVRPWAGSYPSDPVVQHHYEAPRTLETFLHIRVLEASGSTARLININPVNNVLHDFRVRIEATIIGNEEQPAQAWVQRVRADLLTAILANASLGGLTSGIGELVEFVPTENETEFGQQVTLTMTLSYQFRESKEVA